jgi:hypothetical protein
MAATGALLGLALLGLALVALGTVTPFLLIPVVILAVLPFALGLVGTAFRHAEPEVGRDTPRTPTTSEAAYEPVAEPRESRQA